MDAWTSLNIILNVLTMICSVLIILICLIILLVIFKFHRRTKSVPILFAGYTCVFLVCSALCIGNMTMASLLGFMGILPHDQANTTWCYWRGFLVHGFVCCLYDSYILQAAYRICRVVYYQHQRLRNFNLYCILVPIEAIFAIMNISVVFMRGRVVYLPGDFFCQTPFTDYFGLLYIAVRLYGFPLCAVSVAYWYLVRYVRQTGRPTTTAARQRKRSNMRDVTIMARLVVTLIVLILIGLPSIVLLFIFYFTGQLPLITYRIGWLTATISLICLTFIIVSFTIPLRKTINQLARQLPILQQRIVPLPTQ